MAKQFVSEAITAVFSSGPSIAERLERGESRAVAGVPQGGSMPHHDNEPQLPRAFRWRDEMLEITALRKTWHSTKTDRGDVYLKRHWFECETAGGRIATVYYDRGAKRGQPRWWLHTLEI